MASMTDLGALVFLVAFFAIAVLLVKACDRIIGADVEEQKAEADVAANDKVAA
jgi:hypothetical protein